VLLFLFYLFHFLRKYAILIPKQTKQPSEIFLISDFLFLIFHEVLI